MDYSLFSEISGAGKSSYLYQTVIEESLEHPTENYLVLVPEQLYDADAERSLYGTSGDMGS